MCGEYVTFSINNEEIKSEFITPVRTELPARHRLGEGWVEVPGRTERDKS